MAEPCLALACHRACLQACMYRVSLPSNKIRILKVILILKSEFETNSNLDKQNQNQKEKYMSLTNTHNDYLDPDRHLNHFEDYGFERVKAALDAHDTGRGQGDCSWTGKNADLDAGGEQGLTLESVDDEYTTATVYISATFAGNDVCLNLPRWAEEDDETFEQVLEIWLDAAESVVSGCSVAGEWTGDDWCMHESFTVRVKTALNDAADTDAEATATALIKAAQEALEDIEDELVLAHQMMETLAGWRTYRADGTSTRHPEGEPCEGSVWSIFQSQN